MANLAVSCPIVNLRPYQLASIAEVRDAIRKGRRSVMLCIPTGGGKTLTAATILIAAIAKGSRVLFVAHRKELIDQTARTFGRLGVTSYGIIRAKDPRIDLSQPIQIASIQTLARRAPLENIDVVVIDEAHRAMAESYKKFLFDAYPNAVFLGLSATPVRTDGKPLGDAFKALVIGARYSELIDGGHILAPTVYGTPMLPDLAHVRTTAGDFNQEDLEAAVNRSALIGNIVEEWQKRHDGRRTVVFAVSVLHSRALCEAFTAAGARAGHIDGNTPEDERAETLAKLEAGGLDVVCNVGVLCEGWDMPACKLLVLARPTKSLALYMQMAGRILRPWENVSPIILDHGGNVDRHGMPHEDREWSLDTKMKKGGGVAPSKACPKCFAYVAASCLVCPHCEHEFEVGASPPPDDEVDLLPVELALRTLDGDDAQLRWLRNEAKTAAARGWKPGAVYHRFRDRWGCEPPAGWMPAVKKGFKRDEEWQAKVAARAARDENVGPPWPTT
jgi:DNA repair protein RadD